MACNLALHLHSFPLEHQFSNLQLFHPSMSLLSLLYSFLLKNRFALLPSLPITRLLHLEPFRSVVIFIFVSLWFSLLPSFRF